MGVERMEWVLVWLMFAIVVGAIAPSKGRSGFGWFLLATLISPLIAILALIVVPNLKPEQLREAELRSSKICPFCAEHIKRDALVCRFCGRDMPNAETKPEPRLPVPSATQTLPEPSLQLAPP